MNGTLFAAAASLLLALVGCAEAPVATTPPPADAVAAAGAAPARKICHKERPTGSDIPITVCRSAEVEAENARNLEAAQRQIAHDTGVAAVQHAGNLGNPGQ